MRPIDKGNYDYYYWRKGYPLSLFVDQVEKNILKKYHAFKSLKKGADSDGWNDECDGDGKDQLPFKDHGTGLFEKFKLIKQISTRLRIRCTEHIVIGSLWEFEFEGWENRSLVQFALDSGLGERNPLGFGFLNMYY